MASATDSAPGLSFPRDTFAKLTPRPFLLAHLRQPAPIRPNGRKTNEFRLPTINTGSLTHSNGSAVVRVGDTAVVCGIRGEILMASDIPHPPSKDSDETNMVEDLGLIIPNLELSTGCSPAHLPGNPPTSLAQSLSYRISSMLNDLNVVDMSSLRINYTQPPTEEDSSDDEPQVVTKAYWALYVDILCLALDGDPFDAACLAVSAALQDTTLPKAWWDPDQETVLCSPLSSEGSRLNLAGLPIVSSFAVFTTSSPLRKREDAQSWVIADPDSFENDVCDEALTIVSVPSSTGSRFISRIESGGGSFMGIDVMRQCVREAERRCGELQSRIKR